MSFFLCVLAMSKHLHCKYLQGITGGLQVNSLYNYRFSRYTTITCKYYREYLQQLQAIPVIFKAQVFTCKFDLQESPVKFTKNDCTIYRDPIYYLQGVPVNFKNQEFTCKLWFTGNPCTIYRESLYNSQGIPVEFTDNPCTIFTDKSYNKLTGILCKINRESL